MAKFKIGPYVELESCVTARLGSAANANGRALDVDRGKFVKLVGESQYGLCAAGDPIEGWIEAIEPATQDGYAIGTVGKEGRLTCVCDGLQATAGTGAIAVGDFVVCGTPVTLQTAPTLAGPKVCKATQQPGTIAASTVAATNSAADVKIAVDLSIAIIATNVKNSLHPWKVVSLVAGTGAIGDLCVIERAGC